MIGLEPILFRNRVRHNSRRDERLFIHEYAKCRHTGIIQMISSLISWRHEYQVLLGASLIRVFPKIPTRWIVYKFTKGNAFLFVKKERKLRLFSLEENMVFLIPVGPRVGLLATRLGSRKNVFCFPVCLFMFY